MASFNQGSSQYNQTESLIVTNLRVPAASNAHNFYLDSGMAPGPIPLPPNAPRLILYRPRIIARGNQSAASDSGSVTLWV